MCAMRMKLSIKHSTYLPAYELLATGVDLFGAVSVKYKKNQYEASLLGVFIVNLAFEPCSKRFARGSKPCQLLS